MYRVDALSAFIVAGGGALVGAAMLGLVRPDALHVRLALRLFMAAFCIIGVGLFLPFFSPGISARTAVRVTAVGAVVGMAVFGWAFRQLNGARTDPATAAALAVAVGVVSVAALYWGERAFTAVHTILATLVVLVILIDQRKFFRHARSAVEVSLALTLALFLASWALRTGYTLAYDGPALEHMIYMPPEFIGPMVVGYGVMPMMVATLVLSLINERLMSKLHARAVTDELTGLWSRRALGESGPALVARAQAQRQPVCILMIDLDDFKSVNDRYGHQVGDEVLRHFAQQIQHRLRQDALLARYGGEEFTALVPVDSAAHATKVAERIRVGLAVHPFAAWERTIAMTASIGLTLCRPSEDLESALRRADALLYEAKRTGRNRIVSDLSEDGSD